LPQASKNKAFYKNKDCDTKSEQFTCQTTLQSPIKLQRENSKTESSHMKKEPQSKTSLEMDLSNWISYLKKEMEHFTLN
jgi:hypothetical protein